jgi:hypothetical protein
MKNAHMQPTHNSTAGDVGAAIKKTFVEFLGQSSEKSKTKSLPCSRRLDSKAEKCGGTGKQALAI